MRVTILGLALGAVVLGAACDGSPPRTLSYGDVTGIPAGTATGSLYSGDYVVAHNMKDACRCRRGSCNTLTALVGATVHAQQTDGALDLLPDATTGMPLVQGGVSSDGTFQCGAAPGTVQYGLFTGRFLLSGGQPSAMNFDLEATISNTTYDCDLRATASARYAGPLTTPLAAPLTAEGAAANAAAAAGLGLLGSAQ